MFYWIPILTMYYLDTNPYHALFGHLPFTIHYLDTNPYHVLLGH
jgi:DUF438 domain-containing protein